MGMNGPVRRCSVQTSTHKAPGIKGPSKNVLVTQCPREHRQTLRKGTQVRYFTIATSISKRMRDKRNRMYFAEGYRAKTSVRTCAKGQRTQLRPPAHTENKGPLRIFSQTRHFASLQAHSRSKPRY